MKSILSICVLAFILSACSTSQSRRDPNCAKNSDKKCESSTTKSSHDHSNHVRERP